MTATVLFPTAALPTTATPATTTLALKVPAQWQQRGQKLVGEVDSRHFPVIFQLMIVPPRLQRFCSPQQLPHGSPNKLSRLASCSDGRMKDQVLGEEHVWARILFILCFETFNIICIEIHLEMYPKTLPIKVSRHIFFTHIFHCLDTLYLETFPWLTGMGKIGLPKRAFRTVVRFSS